MASFIRENLLGMVIHYKKDILKYEMNDNFLILSKKVVLLDGLVGYIFFISSLRFEQNKEVFIHFP